MVSLLGEGNHHSYPTDGSIQAEGRPHGGSSNSKSLVPFHEPGFLWFRLETLWPFGFQEVAYSGDLQLAHAPRPSPGFLRSTVRASWKELEVGTEGTPQMLC